LKGVVRLLKGMELV